MLTAMGLSEAEALCTVRLSMGRATDDEDIRRAADSLIAGWRAVAG